VGGAPHKTPHPIDEPPPILGSWRRFYVVVLAYLAFLIVLFYLFTRAFDS
jgi:hypothetical protein